MKIRRALLSILSDAAYDTVQSFHSDSAVCFSVFLHHLPDLTSQHPPHVLLRAIEVKLHAPDTLTLSSLQATMFCMYKSCQCGFEMSLSYGKCDICWHALRLQATFASITEAQQAAGITEVSLLNFVVSDGSTLVATRYVSHEEEEPASLYYAEGSAFERCPEDAAQGGPEVPTTPQALPRAADKAGGAPCSPTANAASARNTSVAGEVCTAMAAASVCSVY